MPRGVYERETSIRPGQRYGRWTVITAPVGGRAACRCDCGTEREVRSSAVRTGGSISCGCLRRERHAAAITKHGQADTPVYKVWTAMHQRCSNPKSQMWHLYGSRGIVVDPRWATFAQFAADMGPRPEGGTLERIDSNGNYSPENCRWATVLEQNRNTSRNRYIEFNGETRTISEWARLLGMHRGTLRVRLSVGWSIEDALTPGNRQGARHLRQVPGPLPSR